MDRKIIDQYAAGGESLDRAIAGLSRNDLMWVPPPDAEIGLWSIQQIVIHLMDSDLIWADRMKRMIAEDNPLLIGYDETKFAARLHYEDQDAVIASRIFDLNRRLFASVLRKLPDSAFERKGCHNERGLITMGQSVEMDVWHLNHHLKFVNQKRQKLGKAVKDRS